jgi:hypothetical protein
VNGVAYLAISSWTHARSNADSFREMALLGTSRSLRTSRESGADEGFYEKAAAAEGQRDVE